MAARLVGLLLGKSSATPKLVQSTASLVYGVPGEAVPQNAAVGCKHGCGLSSLLLNMAGHLAILSLTSKPATQLLVPQHVLLQRKQRFPTAPKLAPEEYKAKI
jgi:hypothetical protein